VANLAAQPTAIAFKCLESALLLFIAAVDSEINPGVRQIWSDSSISKSDKANVRIFNTALECLCGKHFDSLPQSASSIVIDH
jgi:hypothetical protein